MEILLSLLTIFLIIFTVYNLKIVMLNKHCLVFLFIISSILIVPLIIYSLEDLGIPILLVFLSLAIYKKTRLFVKTFITITLSLTLYLLADFLSGTIVHSLINMNNLININNVFYYLTLYILNFLFLYLMCLIINKYLKNISFSNLSTQNILVFFIFLSLLITFLIFYINSVVFFEEKILSLPQIRINMFMFSLYFILLILIYYALFQSIKKEAEFINKEKESENLEEYTKNIEFLYNQIRKFKHDYVNILLSMSEYIEQNDMNSLRKYFEENISSLNKDMNKRNFKLDLLQNIKTLELKGVISSKVIMCHDKGIHVHIDIVEPIEHINMDIIDLCRAIGILLDNAIEESEKTSDKSIEIGLINKNNSVTIIITNSCSNEVPPIFKIYESGFSTKGDNRGLGLSNLKEVLSSYKNISIDTSFGNNRFIQILTIQN